MSGYEFFYGATPETFAKARLLRKSMTPAEKELWKHIRNKQLNGLRFRRQHPIGFYLADFYCHDVRLVIELDGAYHGDNTEHDQERDDEMKRIGITVLRFPNEEVFKALPGVLNKIIETSRTILQSSSPSGEGQGWESPSPFGEGQGWGKKRPS